VAAPIYYHIMPYQDTRGPIKNFVVFEGIDGSGTTTQLARLAALLVKHSIPHWVTAEPTPGRKAPSCAAY